MSELLNTLGQLLYASRGKESGIHEEAAKLAPGDVVYATKSVPAPPPMGKGLATSVGGMPGVVMSVHQSKSGHSPKVKVKWLPKGNISTKEARMLVRVSDAVAANAPGADRSHLNMVEGLPKETVTDPLDTGVQLESDRDLRRLEREAASGDVEAQQSLRAMRRRFEKSKWDARIKRLSAGIIKLIHQASDLDDDDKSMLTKLETPEELTSEEIREYNYYVTWQYERMTDDTRVKLDGALRALDSALANKRAERIDFLTRENAELVSKTQIAIDFVKDILTASLSSSSPNERRNAKSYLAALKKIIARFKNGTTLGKDLDFLGLGLQWWDPRDKIVDKRRYTEYKNAVEPLLKKAVHKPFKQMFKVS